MTARMTLGSFMSTPARFSASMGYTLPPSLSMAR
jgi:hypothetical protein